MVLLTLDISGWSTTPWRSPSAPSPSTSTCWCWTACGPMGSVRWGGGGREGGRLGEKALARDPGRCDPLRTMPGRGEPMRAAGWEAALGRSRRRAGLWRGSKAWRRSPGNIQWCLRFLTWWSPSPAAWRQASRGGRWRKRRLVPSSRKRTLPRIFYRVWFIKS